MYERIPPAEETPPDNIFDYDTENELMIDENANLDQDHQKVKEGKKTKSLVDSLFDTSVSSSS